jgi:ethanolamine utilization protein EutQ
MTIRHFSPATASFFDYGEGTGKASVSRLVGPAESTTMGAYYARFNGRRVPWTVHYDEIVICIEGIFELTVGDSLQRLLPGEILWIPKGTSLEYGGLDALVAMTIAPVNWRALEAQAS